ncbi:phosphoadenosine phosphosulfate reductase [Streptomyces sp. DT2A-34]|uniref:phosphoadenosine phosphosulfate reductase n=1 Tax=Streptomyces sp. DT2A-34 TaxID=3051182 RepID=UPI00265C7EF4|nr:phosphoadenosine phosphosulfate reductase [Streptomyces sp. DT2A-34]MDO0914454.1 phosphoadenosine phosphosulfate reductase [Streptomyces sp. DT2A-34]
MERSASAAPGLRAFSFGGGWQSMAALVLEAQGRIDFQTFLFANVGRDSENPGTLSYFERYAAPFAAAHGLTLIELERRISGGRQETIYGRITNSNGSRQTIPVFLSNGKPGKRNCTYDFKILVTGAWLKAHGATEAHPATVAMGISLDEISRANAGKAMPYERLVYPLLDLKIRRADCPRIIRSAGLPVPPKSSCDFCPMRKIPEWLAMRAQDPARFERACKVEETINAHLAAKGKRPVYLTRMGRPLRELFKGGDQLPLFDTDDEGCDSGWCWT